jgi:hypothetical protein
MRKVTINDQAPRHRGEKCKVHSDLIPPSWWYSKHYTYTTPAKPQAPLCHNTPHLQNYQTLYYHLQLVCASATLACLHGFLGFSCLFNSR